MTNNQDYYNRLTLFDTIMQVLTLAMVQADATNNDLMAELQRQNKEYLERIIEQQNEILSMLSELKDMSATD